LRGAALARRQADDKQVLRYLAREFFPGRGHDTAAPSATVKSRVGQAALSAVDDAAERVEGRLFTFDYWGFPAIEGLGYERDFCLDYQRTELTARDLKGVFPFVLWAHSSPRTATCLTPDVMRGLESLVLARILSKNNPKAARSG